MLVLKDFVRFFEELVRVLSLVFELLWILFWTSNKGAVWSKAWACAVIGQLASTMALNELDIKNINCDNENILWMDLFEVENWIDKLQIVRVGCLQWFP